MVAGGLLTEVVGDWWGNWCGLLKSVDGRVTGRKAVEGS